MWHSPPGESAGGRGQPGPQLRAWPGQYGNRNPRDQCGPVLPPMKKNQIVGTHDPDIPVPGRPLQNIRKCIHSIAGASPGFELAHHYPGLAADHFPSGRHSAMERNRGFPLERTPGADDPPNRVKPELADGLARHMKVSRVRRIERTAHEPDTRCGFHANALLQP